MISRELKKFNLNYSSKRENIINYLNRRRFFYFFRSIDNLKIVKLRQILRLIFHIKSILVIFYLLFSKIKKTNIVKKVRIFNNRIIRVYLNDHDGIGLFIGGIMLTYSEFKTAVFFAKNLRESDVFYDVGANYGYYSILAQEIIGLGEVHAFEPNIHIIPLLEKNLSLRKYSRTFLNKLAISDRKGKIKFYDNFIYSHSGGSTILRRSFQKPIKNWCYVVNSITLDKYTKKHKPPTFIKIDVEGAEKLVIKGGIKTLKKYNPKIIMEVFTDKEHISAVKMLLKLGYKMYYIDEKGDYHRVNENIIKRLLNGEIFLQDNYLFMK